MSVGCSGDVPGENHSFSMPMLSGDPLPQVHVQEEDLSIYMVTPHTVQNIPNNKFLLE